MKSFISIVLVMALCMSCSVKPEPLRYSVDNCHFCKMTLADDKFGGELVTKKGKTFKFDDIKCMVAFLNSPDGKENEYAFELVVDYAHESDEFDLIAASDALYILSPEAKSPMAGNVAAFRDQLERGNYQKKWNGTTLSWAGVKGTLK